MPSIIPLVLGALVATGFTTALWRLLRAFMSRRNPSVTSPTDSTALRIQAAVELLWATLLLVQFVFLEALSESREVPAVLAMLATLSGALCLVAALASLASCIAAERRLFAGQS